jgi:hypothetical protein
MGNATPKTVILVHGAWADGSRWSPVITQLNSAGVEATAVQLPLSSLAEDVATVQRAMALGEDRCCWSGIRMAAWSSPRLAAIRKSRGSSTWLRSRPMRINPPFPW